MTARLSKTVISLSSRLQSDSKRISIKELIFYALLAALMFALQVALAPLPNIEMVSLLVLLSARSFGAKSLFSVYIFVLLEGLMYGFGIWWIMYLYIWPVLTIVSILLRKIDSILMWSLISAAYGLSFGTLCSIPYFITGGLGAGIAYWISGIPFDLMHCIANFFICLILFKPLDKLMSKLAKSL